MTSTYLASIGLEVHVQLKTRTKMFCACPAHREGDDPNSHTCPVCLGLPGALPTMNREAIRKTVQTGLMIGSQISLVSAFDRKNYFYPDMPKDFQITQQALPLCIGGGVTIQTPDGPKTIRVNHIHLEEDAAKITHLEHSSEVDYNRASTPLMELVTEPDMASPDEALAFLTALKEMLLYAQISDCNLEMGHMRADVNSSVRPAGADRLGTRTEIKNMNTFRGIHRALEYELARQIALLDAGDSVKQETRRWDDAEGVTLPMRSKEYAHDYRYFPEPDLPPVRLAPELVEQWRAELPELPAARRARFVQDYGLPDYDAGVLTASRATADFFEAVAKECDNPKAASNWTMGEVLRALSESDQTLADTPLTPHALAALIKLLDAKTINQPAAKEVFQILFEQGGDPDAIVKEKGLAQVSDTGALEGFAKTAIEGNPKSVADYRAGKQAALMFLVGQVMKASRGKANPKLAAETLKKLLD
ncbi:MAG: Asp-tRNA(Asn)/Glu-tRNA(Gln) amidotransferase subunit GatB [Kiritimatiellae bacterium]|nr:Asp-tRNA(Asn)/Glu-tRNA(Gln) amidotransferase subunit GatB [Kiritimatiellia bacterium]